MMDVVALGAKGDGTTLNTSILQAAVDAAAKAGSILWFPAGVYLTGTLLIPGGTHIRMHPRAILRGSPNLEEYRRFRPGHNEDRTPWHLLVADGVEDIHWEGGCIDGNGSAFWEPLRGNDPIVSVPARESDVTRASLLWIQAEKKARPSPMIDFQHCRRVRFQNTRITNSAGWNLHLLDCDKVWLQGVEVETNLRGPNNDGFDLTGCRDVIISDCCLSCCDDAIVLKTTPESRSVERVVVSNCIIRTPCAALKIGATESFHDFRQISFQNCIIHESNRAIALYSLEGAVVEDVLVQNIVCDTRTPLLFNRPVHLDVRRKTPASRMGSIRNVRISQMNIRTDGRILLTSEWPGHLSNILLRDVHMDFPVLDDPALAIDPSIGGSQFSNRSPAVRAARAALAAGNVDDLVVENLSTQWPSSPVSPEWDWPLKAANGTDRLFPLQSYRPRAGPAFHFLYGHGLRRGWINAPQATSSCPDAAKYQLESSTIRIVA